MPLSDTFRMSAMTSFIPKTTPTRDHIPAPPAIRRTFGLKTFSTLNPSENVVYPSPATLKPPRKGSIAVLFKKIYFLAHTRLRDICNKLLFDVKIVQVVCLLVCLFVCLFICVFVCLLYIHIGSMDYLRELYQGEVSPLHRATPRPNSPLLYLHRLTCPLCTP